MAKQMCIRLITVPIVLQVYKITFFSFKSHMYLGTYNILKSIEVFFSSSPFKIFFLIRRTFDELMVFSVSVLYRKYMTFYCAFVRSTCLGNYILESWFDKPV